MNPNSHFGTLRCSLIMSCLLMSLIIRTTNRTGLKSAEPNYKSTKDMEEFSRNPPIHVADL